ncbi:hypothetical protein K788_0001365 (plasmid) [Paraburkholderia caribensis MBA4]|uniref:Uncharacterized protein n=1 Tax=Paraburkholderia caribensis MBA4 TaxID=1323664 RepID=A0A0P0RN08_9BURK|nr:hypothetical protein [Paraburkholderia caribensis]ALL70291.1 hypothetical protein K788_0001365 [Paraburkholderia caribensis MBA4]
MIDERAVTTAKFWEALRSLRPASGLPDSEFEQFALIVLGMACVARSHGPWPDELTVPVRKAFEDLTAGAAHRDEHRFSQAWADAFHALVSALRTARRIDFPTAPGSLDAFGGIVTLLDNAQSAWSTGQEFLLDCFDEVFHRLVGRIAGIGYREGDPAAALAAHLSAGVDHIAEYFAATGEFAVLRRSDLDLATSARIAVIDRMNALVGLRLYLHGIDVEDRPPHEDDPASIVARRFLLVDHPRRNTTGRLPHSPRWADHQTSLDALDHFLQNQLAFDMCLIVVPGADRSASGWRRAMREHLVRSNRLRAVIDLPPGGRSRKQVSAWLLVRWSRRSDDVLMVDAKGLAGRGELREVGVLMAFVAAIVSLGASEGWPSADVTGRGRSTSDDVQALLNAYFRDGYP